MIQLLKRLRAKKSYSCSEDREMEEKETRSVESKATCFPHCVDHQSSVSFAKDLKKRSEETSTVNPFESLNILSKGRLQMKEYSGTLSRTDLTLSLSNSFAVPPSSQHGGLQEACSNPTQGYFDPTILLYSCKL